MCDEWKNDFQAFCKWALENGYDSKAKHGECTIDRIDNDKCYSPDNCRWVSNMEQAKNRSDNRYLELDGKKLILSDWSRLLGIPKSTLRKRLDSGWSVEDALTKPIAKQKSSRYRQT